MAGSATAAAEDVQPQPWKGGAAEPLSDGDFKRALSNVAPHLRAFARALSGSRDYADDLAQETMMRAWAARHRYAAGTNFKAWTFTILRNHFYSEARRARFHGDYDEVVAERTLRVNAGQESAVELEDVLRALEMIPSSYREALILVAVGSLSYEEIANICGIALGTVKSRICRARSMLSQALEAGQMPDARHNFVLTGSALDCLFAELQRITHVDSVAELAA